MNSHVTPCAWRRPNEATRASDVEELPDGWYGVSAHALAVEFHGPFATELEAAAKADGVRLVRITSTRVTTHVRVQLTVAVTHDRTPDALGEAMGALCLALQAQAEEPDREDRGRWDWSLVDAPTWRTL